MFCMRARGGLRSMNLRPGASAVKRINGKRRSAGRILVFPCAGALVIAGEVLANPSSSSGARLMGNGSRIHPSAVISSEAELSSDLTVGPLAVIEGKVKIGAG